MSFVDPGEPGELKGNLRAGELLNLPCLFRVTGEGMWAAKEAHTDDNGKKHKAQPEQPYLECDVVVLGASGIEDWGSGVRISWRRVVNPDEGAPQISMANLGQWMPARPRKQEDNSIILTTFDEKGKARAAELLPEAEALFSSVPVEVVGAESPIPEYADGEEPF